MKKGWREKIRETTPPLTLVSWVISLGSAAKSPALGESRMIFVRADLAYAAVPGVLSCG